MKRAVLIFCLFIVISIDSFSQSVENDTSSLKAQKIDVSDLSYNDTLDIDTNQYFVQVFDEYAKQNYANINLGQTGTPALPMLFVLQKNNRIFPFLNNFINYFHTSKFYYNTNKPYTDFKYIGGLKYKEDQYLELIHTQCPDSSSNFGIHYKLYSTQDLQFPKDNSTLSMLNFWYFKSIHSFDIYTSFQNGLIKRLENGGYIDTSESFSPRAKNLTFFLSDVTNSIKQSFFTTQLSYHSTNNFKIEHSFEFKRISKIFSESKPHTEFFGEPLITDNLTYDSTGVRSINNSFAIVYGQKNFLSFNFVNSLQKYYYFRGFLYNLNGEFVTDNYINLSIAKNSGQLNFSANLNYHLTDIYAGDLYFSSYQTYNFNFHKDAKLVFTEEFSKQIPEYFYIHYYGNYDYWNNHFKDVIKTQASAQFIDPVFKFQTGYTYSLFNNYVYLDTIGHPRQLNTIFSINTFYLKKRFELKPLIIQCNIYYQKSNQDSVFNLPEIIASADLFFDFGLAKDNLHVNLGANVVYYSSFYEYKYNPALSSIYTSYQRKTGNYPFLNLFATGKVKSAILIFRFDNALGYAFAPYHETVEHYHIRDFFISFGVQWWFKN